MGCHAGLNVADSLLTGTLPPETLDWAQRYAQAKVAVYIANYTYGYGDTEAAALSERLMALFAARAGADDRTLAEQWVESLHTYFASAGTAYGVYDEKVLTGANLMGPPWYRVSGAPAVTTPAATPTATAGDGLVFSSLTVTPSTTQVGPGSGGGPTYWRGESVLATHYRPIQPVSSSKITPAAGTPPARGIFITALSTHDIANVAPVLAHPTIDLGAHEPKANFDESFFPANYVLLSRTGVQTRAVVAAGQFRPTLGSNRGTQRLVDSISFDVAYDGANATPPQISEVGAVKTPSGIAVFVRATDASGIRRAAVLINDGVAAWRFVALTSQGGGLFTADVTGATLDAEIVAEVENVHGYTGYSTKKGENFNPIIDAAPPYVLVDAPRPDGVYLLNQVVAPRFFCSDAGGVNSCSGPAVDTTTVGPHEYVVVGTDLAGASTTVRVPYFVHFVFVGFKLRGGGNGNENENNENHENKNNNDKKKKTLLKAGSPIKVRWQLRDAVGAFQRDLNTVTSITTRRHRCVDDIEDPLADEVVADIDRLKYDHENEEFVHKLRTQKRWAGTCRTFYLSLSDGTVHTTAFRFR
jgi:hypothetical protein